MTFDAGKRFDEAELRRPGCAGSLGTTHQACGAPGTQAADEFGGDGHSRGCELSCGRFVFGHDDEHEQPKRLEWRRLRPMIF